MATKKASAKTKAPTVNAAPRATTAKAPMSLPKLKPRISAKSVEQAKSAFSNFSLSKFGTGKPPAHYVTAQRSVNDAQKGMISRTIDTLQRSAANRAMTMSLPSADIAKLLPSFDPKIGRVQLDDVLTLLQKQMGGRELYASGNPTLNRLSLEASVQQIFDNFKKDVSK